MQWAGMYRLLPPGKRDLNHEQLWQPVPMNQQPTPGHKPKHVAPRSRETPRVLLKQLRAVVAQVHPRKERHKETARPRVGWVDKGTCRQA